MAWGGGYEYRVLMREGQVAVWPDELVEKLTRLRDEMLPMRLQYSLIDQVIDALTKD